jgi:D-alanyl-lipoteichoic acid acyltransferase DltB (MBOAT superfamily)
MAVATIFQAIAFSYVALRMVDATRSIAAGNRLVNPVALSGYLLPFFMTPAGPINVYADHLYMDKTAPERPSLAGFVTAADLVTSGLFLKFVVAELLRLFFVGLTGEWPTDTLAQSAIIHVYVFFDFLGYSLVALGIGRLLDIPTPVNFRAPYCSKSMTEFWTRWHISLGDFVRRSLFVPLQVSIVRRFGRHRAHLTNLLALILSFGFVGLWHRLTWTFLAWGFFVGVVVALEKVLGPKLMLIAAERPWLARMWVVLGPLYVFALVVCTLHIAMRNFLGIRT